MKKGKAKAKSKPKTAKKHHSPMAAAFPQTDATALIAAAQKAVSQLAEGFKRTPQGIGEEIVKQLGKLIDSSEHEDPEIVKEVIERIANRLVEVLQSIENATPNLELREVVQDQMVFSARRFSDAAFVVLHRIPNQISEVMTLSLVKFIAGQCDKLKKAGTENPQTFRWIAEQNVLWPSVRGLHETFTDNFSDVKTKLKLGAGLTINREPKRAPGMDKAAFLEVNRFLIQAQTPDATFSLASPDSKGATAPTPWGKVFALPALPPLTKETLALWKNRLSLYLEANKKRLMESADFQYVRRRVKTKRKQDKDGSIWSEITRDCAETFERIATNFFPVNRANSGKRRV